jgi:sporulation protein YabP
MDEHMERRTHKITFLNRGVGTVTGVRDVKAFNESEIILDTDMGQLSIKGSELHVTKLTLEKGEVEVDGTVDSFIYTSPKDAPESGGLFGKLFR